MARRVLFDALAARYGGGAYAAVQLARNLAASPVVSSVVVVARRGSIVERGLAREPTVNCIALPPARRIELARRMAWEGIRLPALVRRERCDVMISMSGMVPRPAGCRVTCILANPVLYERRTPANLLRRWAIRRTAQKAVYLAAPSGFMADLVSASAGRPCGVLTFGVDHDIFRPSVRSGEEILCVADFYAHKRHDLLIDAWLRLPAPRPRLRLVGNPAVDRKAHERLLARIASLPEAESIVLEHRVALECLVRAYHGARVFVMPSEHESFCMPLAESMACGIPAVVRDIRSLRETGGAGATYVEGDDPARWAEAIARMLRDDGERDSARERAIAEAGRFSWERCAATLATHL